MVEPWSADAFQNNLWIFLMGFLVATACGLVGNYLILRRMSLIGDAISHSILPGIAIAFLVSGSRGTVPMFAGALLAGVATTVIIEVIHKKSRIKQDSAIGIAFTTLFAIGVILISLYASKIDLDQECVLYGEIGFVGLHPPVQLWGMNLGPLPVFRMAVVTVITAAAIMLFYKELLVSSFDPGLAFTLGINATVVHYCLMGWLSTVVVNAFESVGAVLVIAMLILPGAIASMLTLQLPRILMLTVVIAAMSSFFGIHLATWLNCSTAAAMVVVASGLFILAWLFSPTSGLVFKKLRHRSDSVPEFPETATDVLNPQPGK